MRRIRSGSSEMNAYLNELKRNGYLLEMGGRGHWKIYLRCDRPTAEHPGGRHCKDCSLAASTSASPSDRRTLENLRRELKSGTGEIMARRNKPRYDVVKLEERK